MTKALVASALVVTLVAASGCCCFSDEEGDKIAALEKSIKGLEKKQKRLEGQLKLVEETLALPAGAPMVVAVMKPSDIENAIKNALPLSFPADRLHNLVSGTVVITGWSNVKLSGNKVEFDLVGKGKKLKINTMIPPGYEKMAKELIGGLQSGLTIHVVGTFDASPGNKLVFKGKATNAKLKKHNKDDYRAQIKSAVNKQFLKSPHTVKVARVTSGGKYHDVKAAVPVDGRLAVVFAP